MEQNNTSQCANIAYSYTVCQGGDVMDKKIDCTKCVHFPKATKVPRMVDTLMCDVDRNAVRSIGPDRKQYHCDSYESS